jgi:cupin 2 domain-containing protein
MSLANLFKPDTAEDSSEEFERILQNERITIERILSPPMTVTEISAQSHDEWVCILQGNARLEMGEEVQQLHRGDHVLIPANTPHRVLTTSHKPHCIWLAIHMH